MMTAMRQATTSLLRPKHHANCPPRPQSNILALNHLIQRSQLMTLFFLLDHQPSRAHRSDSNCKWRRRFLPAVEALETRLTPSVEYTAVAAGDATEHDAILWTRALDPKQPRAVSLIAEVSTDPTFTVISATYLG